MCNADRAIRVRPASSDREGRASGGSWRPPVAACTRAAAWKSSKRCFSCWCGAWARKRDGRCSQGRGAAAARPAAGATRVRAHKRAAPRLPRTHAPAPPAPAPQQLKENEHIQRENQLLAAFSEKARARHRQGRRMQGCMRRPAARSRPGSSCLHAQTRPVSIACHARRRRSRSSWRRPPAPRSAARCGRAYRRTGDGRAACRGPRPRMQAR